MHTSGIDWCDMSWNPVTGCLKGCNYCYAKGIAHRFGDAGSETGGLHVLDSPVLVKTKHSKRAEGPIATRRNYFPYGFDPTFHWYRLGLPGSVRVPQRVFVGSMCDLFGDWVPDEWIAEVFEACRKTPKHKYMFLTKNPVRYLKLIEEGKLLTGDNIWYGATFTGRDERLFYADGFNTFLSVEPLLADAGIENVMKEAGAKWVILGAETGSRADGSEKVVPKKAWIQRVVDACRDAQVPLFMKHNIESAWGGEMVRQLPGGACDMNAADVIEFCKKNNVDIRIRLDSRLYEYQVRVEQGCYSCVFPICGAEMDLALPETKNVIAERAFEEIASQLRYDEGQ